MSGENGNKEQLEKFKEAARESGCNEDEGAFEGRLRKIAQVKPKPADGAEPKNDKAPE